MMRPVLLAVPPRKAIPLTAVTNGNGGNARVTVTWTDNSITETSFVIQRTTDGTTWSNVGNPILSPLDQVNTNNNTRTFIDTTSNGSTPYQYRIVAQNTVGYGGAFPSMTVKSESDTVGANKPAAPTNLVATLQAGPRVSLTWRDNASNEFGFVVERSADGGTTFATIATPAARGGTGNVTFVDSTVASGTTYVYRVSAVNFAGSSAPSVIATAIVAVPVAPVIASATAARQGGNERVTVTWGTVTNVTSYTIQWSTSSTFATVSGSGTAAANATSFTTGTIARQAWFVRVGATNALGTTWSTPSTVPAAP